MLSIWRLYYSREPLGSGVTAWNAHYFPTGSRAQRSTIAPRPDVSVACTVGGLSRILLQARHKTIQTVADFFLAFLLKTCSLWYILQFHCKKKIIKKFTTLQKYWKAFFFKYKNVIEQSDWRALFLLFIHIFFPNIKLNIHKLPALLGDICQASPL